MSVNERLEDPGSFEVRLDATKVPYAELRKLEELGHIVITPQWFPHPGLFAESDLLTSAKYSGVLLSVDSETDGDSETIVLRGQGNVWHLGDAFGNGPILAADRSFTAAALTDVLAPVTSGGILPPAVKVGTITTTGLGTFPPSGTVTFYESQTCLECVRTVMSTMGMTYRIKPNWEIDASKDTRDEVFVTTTPTVVAVPKGFGADPQYIGLEPDGIRSRVDASRWVSRSVIEQTDAAGARSILSFVNRSYIPYQDPHGNELVRNVIQSGPSSDDVGFTAFHDRTLAEWNTVDEQEIDTGQMEFSGPFKVGDWIYVYDPARGFIDTANQITFRGQVIAPVKMRATEDEWNILSSYGVYYRPASVRYRQAVLADGPEAYWRLDETSGTSAADETGNGHGGTYVGAVTLNADPVMVDGSSSPSADFSGGGHVNVAEYLANGWTALTLEAWVVQNSSPGTTIVAGRDKISSDNPNPYAIAQHPSGKWDFRLHSGGTYRNVLTNAATGRHHLVLTYDGTTLRGYVDGNLVGSTPASGAVQTDTTLPFRIGAYSDSATTYPGRIDEVALYNKSLSESRIKLHYAIGTQRAQAGRWVDLSRYVIPEAA